MGLARQKPHENSIMIRPVNVRQGSAGDRTCSCADLKNAFGSQWSFTFPSDLIGALLPIHGGNN